MKIQIIFHSMSGHVYKLAESIAAGAREVYETGVALYQVPELIPQETLVATGAQASRSAFSHIPVATPEQMVEADAIIFGTPTRFGMMSAQMRSFLDHTGKLWKQGSLVGKIGSVFVSTATQHGGQETTISSFHTSLLHHGMIVVGVPYSEQRLLQVNEVSGGSPYGASTLSGGDGDRWPSANELAIARYQGRHVADIAKRLHAT